MARLTYILLSRTIYDSALWRENPSVIKLFIYLLGSARFHKESKSFPGFELQRGEILTSLSDIADNNEWVEHGGHKKWSRAKVCRMLESLEKGGYINRISDTYGTHIKICNYSRYQDPSIYGSDSDETEVKRTCNGSETEVKPYKKDKKVKKEKNEKNNINIYTDGVGVEETKEPVKGFPNILLTLKEKESIKARYETEGLGAQGLIRALEILTSYSINQARKFNAYRSHYHVLIGWVLQSVKKEAVQENWRAVSESKLTLIGVK